VSTVSTLYKISEGPKGLAAAVQLLCAAAEDAVNKGAEAIVLSDMQVHNTMIYSPRVAAPSPRASLGRRTVCGRTEQRQPPVPKRYETNVRMV